MHSYTGYFKSNPGFDRFIKKLYEKYRSLSRFSGIVKLKSLSVEEAEALSRFFGTTYKEKEDISISIKKFIEIMNHSKYDDFAIEILVSEYLQVPLITNKEKKNKCLQEERIFYQEIIGKKETPSSKFLLSVIESKENPYKLIQQRYKKNKDDLKKELINVIDLIDNLPQQKILLPIYASQNTGDPHYLDLDNKSNILFFYALSYIDKTPFPKQREDKIKLLSKYNIEIDNLSNYVLTYNLLSDKEYITAFSSHKETVILNIQNIISTSIFDTKKKKVFIFENPSMLTEIIKKELDMSIIISGGFPNSSVYLLLDKLVESHNKLYYNGDFDPEGLLIAQKLKDKYKENLELICYEGIYYNTFVSKKRISDKRLSKLSSIKDKKLLEIKEKLLVNKYPVYQENNKDCIIEFILKMKDV